MMTQCKLVAYAREQDRRSFPTSKLLRFLMKKRSSFHGVSEKGSCGRRTNAAPQRKGEPEWQRPRASQRLNTISMAMVRRLFPGRRYASGWNRGLPRFRDQEDLIGIPVGWQRSIQTGDHTSCPWESTGWMAPYTS